MKKRSTCLVCLLVLFVICIVALVACDLPQQKTYAQEVYSLYVAYAEENGVEAMSYEQWLATIKGEKGEDGATWLVGSDNPNSQGKDGDLYLNTSTNDIFRKENGNWCCVGNIANQSTQNSTSDFVFAECDGGYAMIRYVGNDEQVTVPSTYNGKPVVQIGYNSDFNHTGFANCLTVKKIVIPENVKSVYYGAFVDLPLLEEITLPATLEEDVEIICYAESESLISPVLRINLTNFALWVEKDISIYVCGGEHEFYFDGEPLGKNVIIPDGVTKIGSFFTYNDNIENVFIPDSVTQIDRMAFSSDSNITSVTFENPQNWYVGGDLQHMDTLLSSDDLANTATAASYLTNKYRYSCWLVSATLPIPNVTIKELMFSNYYLEKQVQFDAQVVYHDESEMVAYVQQYDQTDNLYYGIYIYYGYFSMDDLFNTGNLVHIVGQVQFCESKNHLQIVNVSYEPNSVYDGCKLLSQGSVDDVVYPELTSRLLYSSVEYVNQAGAVYYVEYYQLAKNIVAMMYTLTVISVETADDGSMMLTCQSASGGNVCISTGILYDEIGSTMTADDFLNKTIYIKGIYLGKIDDMHTVRLLDYGFGV